MSSEGEDGVMLLSPWVYSVSLVLILVATICCIGSWVLVFYYRKKPIVAMGQPEFLYNICFGVLLQPISLALQITVVFRDYDEKGIISQDTKTGIILEVCCNFSVWLNYIGYSVILTALLCKIYRIQKLTQQPLRRGLKILPRHVLWPFILVVSMTISLLIAWSATGTTKYIIAEYTDTNKMIGYCAFNWDQQNEKSSKCYIIALFALMMIVELVLIILACRIRKTNQELGDSKRILRLLLFWFVVSWVCLGIMVAITQFVENDDNAHNISALVYVIQFVVPSIATIIFIIFPRIYYVWYEHRHGHLPEYVVMIGGTTTVRGVNQSTRVIGITPRHILKNNYNDYDGNNNINICDGMGKDNDVNNDNKDNDNDNDNENDNENNKDNKDNRDN